MIKAFQSILNGWETKSILALIISGLTALVTNSHFLVLVGFCFLVLLDLLTKQMALSSQHIAESTGKPITEIDTISKVLGIPVAINDGVISSKFMREKFCAKVITYIIACFAAAVADVVIVNTPNGFILNCVYSYLGATEFISILENLRDGGNTMVGNFVQMAKDKIIGRLK